MKNIVVTGASRGIGRAIAARFAAMDCNLLINSMNAERLEAAAAELRQLKTKSGAQGRICAVAGDIGDSGLAGQMLDIFAREIADKNTNVNTDADTSVNASVNASTNTGANANTGASANTGANTDINSDSCTTEQFRVDVLVNNAGISYVGLLQDMTDEEWVRLMTTNLSSVHYMSRAVIPGMIAAHSGHIINISSVWGCVGASCEVAYSASKGGVNAYTRALAKELAPSGISVNAIACGCIDTDMNGHLSQEDRLQLCEEIPAGRFAEPKEVAELVYSMSEQSAYLTGQIVNFDGGWI